MRGFAVNNQLKDIAVAWKCDILKTGEALTLSIKRAGKRAGKRADFDDIHSIGITSRRALLRHRFLQ